MKVLNNSYLYRDIYKIPYHLQNLCTAQLYYVSPCHMGSTQFDLFYSNNLHSFVHYYEAFVIFIVVLL